MRAASAAGAAVHRGNKNWKSMYKITFYGEREEEENQPVEESGRMSNVCDGSSIDFKCRL